MMERANAMKDKAMRPTKPSWEFDSSDLVSRKEVARRLLRTEKTIANWVSTRGIPVHVVHKKYMFLLSELREWAKDKSFIKDHQRNRLNADFVFDD